MEGLHFPKKSSAIEKADKGASDKFTGLENVFELNPEVLNVGTKEQYRSYLETIFPQSKVQEILYHAGSKDIERFKVKGDEGYQKNDPYTQNGIYLTGSLLHAKKYLAGFGAGNPLKAILNYVRKGSVYDDNKQIHAVVADIQNPVINSRKDEQKHFLPKSLDSIRDEDLQVMKVEGKDGVVFDELATKDALGYVVALHPDQVHILGSKADIGSFQKWVEESNTIK